MLKTLDIENVALIDKLSIDFSSKFTVLSGETGAGKSIIIDALNFVLGGKTNKNLIKQNEKRMRVSALFSGNFTKEAQTVLKEYGIDFDDEVIISRTLFNDGKGEMRINGVSVTTTMLKNLSTLLVDIHGQHEHQRLLKDKFHLEILDGFIKDKSVFTLYENLLHKLKETNSQIEKLNFSFENQERVLDLLSYQIKEIEDAQLKENEDDELEKTKFLMRNYEKVFDNLSAALESLDGETSLVEEIKKATMAISSITQFDENLTPIIERLDSVKYEISDISQTLAAKKKESDFDEIEFEQVDNRLDKINLLKKKYGKSLDDIFEFLKNAKEEYNAILNSKELLGQKLNEKSEILKEIFIEAQKISTLRKQIAREFEEKTKKELFDLGIKNAKFLVNFAEFDKRDFEKKLTSKGLDDIKFLFSANIGQEMRPLSDIISGGEASRFMLALKNILAESDNIMLMVFDEIDSGISGEMGFSVASKLANISRRHQVISVSHLPQICAMADRNIQVQKYSEKSKTLVSAKTLSENEALEEISKLSGGSKNNEVSLQHARLLKRRCEEYKNAL